MNMKTCLLISLFIYGINCNKSEQPRTNVENKDTTKQLDGVTLDIEEQNESSNGSAVVSTEGAHFCEFDWNKVIVLKKGFVERLVKKESSEDRIVFDFLAESERISSEIGRCLGDDGDKYFHFFLYNKKWDGIDSRALDFKRFVDVNGFRFDHEEGSLYVTPSSNFIKTSGLLPLVDSVSAEYMVLYGNELDSICCMDATIIISIDEVARRAYNWGELSRKVASREYRDSVEHKYYLYLSLIIDSNLDNSLSFNSNDEFDMELIPLMNNIIIKYPESRVAGEIKTFLGILEKENYKKTQKVKEYLNNLREG